MGNKQAKPVKPKFRPDDRIVVLGAGPAGTAAAYYLLKEKGYKNVTLIEKKNFVGGKCHSYAMEDGSGCYVDLGAVEVTEDYHCVIALMKELNLYDSAKYVVPPCTLDRGTGDVSPIADFVKLRATEGHRIYETLGLSEIAFLDQCMTYLNHCKKWDKWLSQPGCHNCPKELGVPFLQYLKDNGMAGIASIFVCPIPLFGYGELSEICAGYAMKYMNHSNFMTLLKRGAREALITILSKMHIKYEFTEGFPKRLERGYQSLVIAMEDAINTMGGKVLKGTTTTKVVRDNGVITLTAKTGDEEAKTMEFDHMIVAFPQRLVNLSFMTLSKQEADVFTSVNYMNYSSALWRQLDTANLDGSGDHHAHKKKHDPAKEQEEAAKLKAEAEQKNVVAVRHNSLYSEQPKERKVEPSDAEKEQQEEEMKLLERTTTITAHAPKMPVGIVCCVFKHGKVLDKYSDGQPCLFFKRPEVKGFVSYAVHEDLTFPKEKFEDNTREMLNRLGYLVAMDPITSHVWEYFPHFKPADFVEKNNQLFALQGQWNTFYTGGLCCFEDVEKSIEYSHFLVQNFF